MKKAFIFVLAGLMLCLCACGTRTVTGQTSNAASTAQSTSQTTAGETAEKTAEEAMDTTAAEGINTTTANYESIITTRPQTEGKVIKGEAGAASLSGFAPLSEVKYEVEDPGNTAGLSTKKVSHSHGPASGGQAHRTVVEFQKTFDKYGALTLDTVSQNKVLYLTFDCGWENNNLTSSILDVLAEKDVPAAFFCTLTHIKQQPELISRMIKEGHIVGNHSATHPSFASIDRTQMVKEIGDTENYLRAHFGYAAKYFRFPAGEYSECALELVDSLGYMSVFWSLAYDDWDVNTVRGAEYTTDIVMERLHPGAVILLHSVSQDNADALGKIIDLARAEGYEFLSLEDYPA